MKFKYATIFLGLFFSVFVLSGCSTQSSDSVVQTAVSKTLSAMQATPTLLQLPPTWTPEIIPTKVEERQGIIDKVITLLNQKTNKGYDDALNILKDLIYTAKYADDEEIQALCNYSLGMSFSTDGTSSKNVISSFFWNIPPTYNGVYSQEIRNAALQYMSIEEWTKYYQGIKPSLQTQTAKLKKQLPAIGMTAEQVRNSQWGKPKSVNKTTTKNAVSEQWVYSTSRYIYLENGIVTAIQQ